eukprot:TRINITY_DN3157_c0_g1_i1.p1 TRINITY_DN3157_c0_g1~~TRINITY_DN3157_c0_g1_i1.p1  ORF type:complete len:296 (+),score=56.63 TRINITY_DN3157_c0_g1_i1:349-1236(+)
MSNVKVESSPSMRPGYPAGLFTNAPFNVQNGNVDVVQPITDSGKPIQSLWRMMSWEDQTHKFVPPTNQTTTHYYKEDSHMLTPASPPGSGSLVRSATNAIDLSSPSYAYKRNIAASLGKVSSALSATKSTPPPKSPSLSPPSSPEDGSRSGSLSMPAPMHTDESSGYLSPYSSNPEVPEVATSGSRKRKQLSSRTRHNLAEQKRRQQMRDSFERLKTAIPNGQRKISKVALLNETHAYIMKLQENSAKVRADNLKLQQELCKYEKQQQNGSNSKKDVESGSAPLKKRARIMTEEH